MGLGIGLYGLSAMPERPAEAKIHKVPKVVYGGVELPVPRGWKVYDLAKQPKKCIRFDVHAIYVGLPKGEPKCPSKIVGRTEAIHLTPIATVPSMNRRTARKRLTTLRVTGGASREFALALPEAGVRITGTYAKHPERLQSVLRQASVGPGRTRSEPPPRATITRRAWATGPGFDTCAAPSLATMQAWRKAYAIANIYIGGAARGCAQPNLTSSWVRSVRQMGYRLIPTYVGLQAPCTNFAARFKTKEAAKRGKEAASDAVAKAKALGIPAKRPIYFDMEAYNSGNTTCKNAVMTFFDAWTRRLHALDYKSGVYSSAGSGIRDLGRAQGIKKPNSIWFAHWDGRAKTTPSSYLAATWWAEHRRIKQYRGGHTETHGGVQLNVDSNVVDGLVY
ncbi:DUF1906 domain-containing protein [Actinocorallia lasiicapitis]